MKARTMKWPRNRRLTFEHNSMGSSEDFDPFQWNKIARPREDFRQDHWNGRYSPIRLAFSTHFLRIVTFLKVYGSFNRISKHGGLPPPTFFHRSPVTILWRSRIALERNFFSLETFPAIIFSYPINEETIEYWILCVSHFRVTYLYTILNY